MVYIGYRSSGRERRAWRRLRREIYAYSVRVIGSLGQENVARARLRRGWHSCGVNKNYPYFRGPVSAEWCRCIYIYIFICILMRGVNSGGRCCLGNSNPVAHNLFNSFRKLFLFFAKVWLTMSDGTLLDCCYARAYGGRNGVGCVGGQGHESQPSDAIDGDGRRSTGCVLFCNPNAGYYETMALAGDRNCSW